MMQAANSMGTTHCIWCKEAIGQHRTSSFKTLQWLIAVDINHADGFECNGRWKLEWCLNWVNRRHQGLLSAVADTVLVLWHGEISLATVFFCICTWWIVTTQGLQCKTVSQIEDWSRCWSHFEMAPCWSECVRCMEADLGVCGCGAGLLEAPSTKAAKSFALPHQPFSAVAPCCTMLQLYFQPPLFAFVC